MKENDLRVIKTRENIDNAFMELLKTKKLPEITVTGLSKLARISKGTFYLHYRDIFDLYDNLVTRFIESSFTDSRIFALFFDEPKAFFTQFDKILQSNSNQQMLLIQGGGQNLIDRYINVITEKLYETGRIRKSRKNNCLISLYFAGLQYITSHQPEEFQSEVNQIMTSELLYILKQLDYS